MAEEFKEESQLDVLSRYLLKENIDIVGKGIWIEGPISHKNFIKFDKQLKLLECTTEEPLCVYINSGGGDVYSMFAFIDRIQSSSNHIITIGTGLVASAAVPILASGHKRTASRNLTIMHHTASTSYGYNRLPVLKNDIEHVNVLEIKICQFLANNSKKGLSFWTSKGKHTDFYFSAEEALSYGLIDEIV